MARGYLDHEAAHIRHTDFNAMLAANMDKTTKWLFMLTGNPKIFRSEVEQAGLSTAVHILLDCSASMVGSSMPLAREASYAVAKTLYGIPGVNSAVTAFPADYEDNSVYPVLRHGQRLTENFMLRPAGDTPLGPAIWWAMNEILKLKEDRKIILIITDGVPNSPEAAQCAIEHCCKLGIEKFMASASSSHSWKIC